MGVECYDCYVCKQNGVWEGAIAHCETCFATICLDCLDVEGYNDDKFDEDQGLKSEYCQACKDREKNKYVYVLLIINSDRENYITVHREQESAEAFREKHLKEEYKSYNNKKDYEGDDIIEEMREFGYCCEINKTEIMK